MNDTKSIILKIKSEISQKLLDVQSVNDEKLYELIDGEIEREEENSYLPVARKLEIRNTLFDSFRRLDLLQELLDRKDVTEIMINGPDDIFIESSGKIQKWDKHFESQEQLEDMIQQVVSRVNRVINTSSPIVDARLEEEPTFIILILLTLISL